VELGGTISAGCPSQTRVMTRFATASAVVGIAAGALFVLVPEIDLIAAKAFYVGGGSFAGGRAILVPLVREVFLWTYVAASALAVVGIALTIARRSNWGGLCTAQWVFVALCLSIGPGVVANEIFKDNWGRARPRQIAEFGGDKPFTPALVQAQNCERNCSFVSGEASSIFALCFAAAALFRQRALVLIGSGVILGSLAGLMRMAQGAHFLSDVVFAGVFMALTVVGLFLLFEARTEGGAARLRSAIAGRAATA